MLSGEIALINNHYYYYYSNYLIYHTLRLGFQSFANMHQKIVANTATTKRLTNVFKLLASNFCINSMNEELTL